MDTPDERLEPFTTAVATTFRELAGVEVVVRDTSRAAGGEAVGDVSVVLQLYADHAGSLILSFPSGTALAVARRVLAGVVGEPDEDMIRDCAGELANVIAGQAKVMLFGTPGHFTLSTPTVVSGGLDIPAGRSVVRFDSDAGAFTLYLSLPLAAADSGA